MGFFRIHWGFIGPKYARFSSFPPSNLTHARESLIRVPIRQIEEIPSHSAIGELAVYLFLVLIMIALTGISSSDDILFDGPLASLLQSAMVSLPVTVHPILSDLLLVIIGVHLIAVTWHITVIKEPFIREILTSRNPAFEQEPVDPHAFSGVIFQKGLIFSLIIFGLTLGIIGI